MVNETGTARAWQRQLAAAAAAACLLAKPPASESTPGRLANRYVGICSSTTPPEGQGDKKLPL